MMDRAFFEGVVVPAEQFANGGHKRLMEFSRWACFVILLKLYIRLAQAQSRV